MSSDTSERIRLDLAYDGDAFHGWAAQPGLRTVQGVLQEALFTLIRREVPMVVAGRTDAGVHARGQVVHLDLTGDEWRGLSRGRDVDPSVALLRRLSGVLARQKGAVVVHGIRRVPDRFDARFSALSRTYSYRIADVVAHDGTLLRDPLRRQDTAWVGVGLKQRRAGRTSGLDVSLMDVEASSTLGLHDFGSFCRPWQHSTTIRDLQSFSIRRQPDGVILAEITADAFCHHMVRALIGACIDVGEGRREPGWLAARLRQPSWDAAVRLAPPHGLVLERVDYPAEEQLAARAQQTRAVRPT